MREVLAKNQAWRKKLILVDQLAKGYEKYDEDIKDKLLSLVEESQTTKESQDEEVREKTEKTIEKHFKKFEELKEPPVIYFIAERKRVFTTEKNELNLLYIGETSGWQQRKKNYENVDSDKNELVVKLANKIKFDDEKRTMHIDDEFGSNPRFYKNKEHPDRLDKIRDLLRDNFKVFVLRRKRYHDRDERIKDETKFIQQYKPLINSAQTDQETNEIMKDLLKFYRKDILKDLASADLNTLLLIKTEIPEVAEERLEAWMAQSIEYKKLINKGWVDEEQMSVENVNFIIKEMVQDNKTNLVIAEKLGWTRTAISVVISDLFACIPITEHLPYPRYIALPKNSVVSESYVYSHDITGVEPKQEENQVVDSLFEDLFDRTAQIQNT